MADHTELIDRGRSALARGDWQEARALFGEVLEGGDDVDALAGLGIAARMQQDGDVAVESHERAYRAARASNDTQCPADWKSVV